MTKAFVSTARGVYACSKKRILESFELLIYSQHRKITYGNEHFSGCNATHSVIHLTLIAKADENVCTPTSY